MQSGRRHCLSLEAAPGHNAVRRNRYGEQKREQLSHRACQGIGAVNARWLRSYGVVHLTCRWLVANAGGDVKVFVDTAAVMEKPLAASAGLGWQGKHTNLVSREFGSWLFLGAIFTTLELQPDEAEPDHCGTCRNCLDVCPTAAFPEPYRLDARRCISYLTIESKGPIPREFRKAIGNRIYGCDDCLAVCPWNKFAQQGRETKLAARDELRAPSLADLARLDDAAFRARFTKSPVKRIGRDRFVRNVLIAIGNSNDRALAAEADLYRRRRLREAEAGCLTVTVGHADLLVLP